MSDGLIEKQDTNGAKPAGFPFLTVLLTLLILFLFATLMLLTYNYSFYAPLSSSAEDQETANPARKLAEIQAKNQAILEGRPETGTAMSLEKAMDQLLSQLRSEKDTMPFPKPLPAPPAETKDKSRDKK